MAKFIHLLNSDEEWLPLAACWSNDHSCKTDDTGTCYSADDKCDTDDNDICGVVADDVSVTIPVVPA